MGLRRQLRQLRRLQLRQLRWLQLRLHRRLWLQLRLQLRLHQQLRLQRRLLLKTTGGTLRRPAFAAVRRDKDSRPLPSQAGHFRFFDLCTWTRNSGSFIIRPALQGFVHRR